MMQVFADTSFYVALLNRTDALHAAAVDWASRQRPAVVTTEFVLLETANFFKHPLDRGKFAAFVEGLRSDSATNLVPCDSSWFQKGLDRFSLRLDKEWSLTDCISFVVMEEHGLTEALSEDHHFEQAGFIVLLR
jgi:predicted nucleic acid-binding protein